MNSDFEASSTIEIDLVAKSWARFLSTITSEQLAVDVLYGIFRRISTPTCIRCGSQKHKRTSGSRILVCLDCNGKASFTAQTFFHSAKKVRPWLGVFWLIENGLEFSVRKFSLLAEISYGTAWFMYKKVDCIANRSFETDALSALSIDFVEVFLKRSRETLARMHPMSEQSVKEAEENAQPGHDGKPASGQFGDEGQTNSATDDLSDDESQILQAISDSPIDFQTLHNLTGFTDSVVSSALSLLEILSLIKRVEGDKYIRAFVAKVCTKSDRLFSDDADAMVALFINFVKRRLQGISRKYLQFHLAKFWYVIDLKRWGSGELLATCIKQGRIFQSEIDNFNSPIIVQLPRRPSFS